MLATRVRKDRALYSMLAVPVIFFLVFHYQPMYGVLIAFKEYKISKGILGSPWADNFGLYHFIRFFSSSSSFRLINNTFQISFWTLVWGFPAPIILALLLHECRLPRFKKTVQTVTYLPHFISIVAIVGILTLLLSPRDGSINHMLAMLGLNQIYFMADTSWFRPVYVLSNIWTDMGFGAIIYLAAVSRANPELYEAATVDGANSRQQFWHITIPMLSPAIFFVLITSLIGAFQAFDAFWLMTRGGPAFSTTTMVLHIFNNGFQYFKMGYASSMALILFGCIMFFTLVQWRVAKNWVYGFD